jgi:hypothetical protein
MPDRVINPAALTPLYAPHEEPNRHRVRARRDGEPVGRTSSGRWFPGPDVEKLTLERKPDATRT